MARGGFKQKQKEVIWTLLWVLLDYNRESVWVGELFEICLSPVPADLPPSSAIPLWQPSSPALFAGRAESVPPVCQPHTPLSTPPSTSAPLPYKTTKLGEKKIYVFYLMLKDIWSHCMPPWIGLWFHCFFAQITIHNSCCNICYVSNTDECDPERCQENKLKQHTRKGNCFGRDMKDSLCTAEHLSISGPNHLPSCPSFASLRFWSTSFWPHAVAAGSRSPPLNLDITNNAKRLQTTHIIIKKIHYIHNTTFTGIPSCRHKFCQSSIHLLLVSSVFRCAATGPHNNSWKKINQVWIK